MSATRVGPRHKRFKLHRLKRLKTVPKKRNLDQKTNDSKLIFAVYLLISDFLVESLETNKNQQKDHSFHKVVSLKKPHSFYKPELQHSQKPYSLYRFPIKHVSDRCQKKHFHCTISRRPRTAFSKNFETNVCIFLYIFVRKLLFQRHTKFLSGGVLNNFLKMARC